MDHAQLLRGQHHGEVVGIGELRQDLGMAWENVAALVQRLLVERRGADRVDFTCLGELDSPLYETEGRIARRGRDLAKRQVRRQQINKIYAIDRAEVEARLARVLNAVNRQVAMDDAVGAFEESGITDHQGPTDRVHLRIA